MRKTLSIVLIAVMLIAGVFLLTGCGNEELENNNTNNQQENNNNNNDNNNDNTSEIDILELYSDDTKIVYDMSVYKLVYYHNGTDITGLEWYYEYPSVEYANVAVATIEAEAEDTVKSVKQNGKYVVVEFSEEEYKDMTLEEVRETYSYLEEVYNN